MSGLFALNPLKLQTAMLNQHLLFLHQQANGAPSLGAMHQHHVSAGHWVVFGGMVALCAMGAAFAVYFACKEKLFSKPFFGSMCALLGCAGLAMGAGYGMIPTAIPKTVGITGGALVLVAIVGALILACVPSQRDGAQGYYHDILAPAPAQPGVQARS